MAKAQPTPGLKTELANIAETRGRELRQKYDREDFDHGRSVDNATLACEALEHATKVAIDSLEGAHILSVREAVRRNDDQRVRELEISDRQGLMPRVRLRVTITGQPKGDARVSVCHSEATHDGAVVNAGSPKLVFDALLQELGKLIREHERKHPKPRVMAAPAQG